MMKTKLFRTVYISTMLLILASCLSSCKGSGSGGGRRLRNKTTYRTFTFKQKEDVINIKPELKHLLQSKPNCAFLVRVPNKANSVVEEEKDAHRYLYFALEKTLIDSHYVVRDRSLFLGDDAASVESRQNTDLIIELIDYKIIQYYTNKYKPETAQGNDQKIMGNYVYFAGKEAKFKIIDIKTNEVVGIFTFNYTPCVEGCTMQYVNGIMTQGVENLINRHTKRGYESAESNTDLDEFTDLCQRLMQQLHLSTSK